MAGKIFQHKNSKIQFRVLCSVMIIAGVVIAGSLAGCFSSWQGDYGVFTINIADSGRSLADWPPSVEVINMTDYVITVSGGPGPDQIESFTGSKTVQFSVAPGKWDIVIEAFINEESNDSGNAVRRLYAIGKNSVNIKPGVNQNIIIDMKIVQQPLIATATAATWGELCGIINATTGTEIILLTADMFLSVSDMPPASGIEAPIKIKNSNDITLIANSNITIGRATTNPVTSSFFDVELGYLTLGHPMMEGTIAIDGFSMITGPNPLIIVEEDGVLWMDSGVALINNVNTGTLSPIGYEGKGGAVYVAGALNMFGGRIENNTAINGGGVYVASTGSFLLGNAVIKDNEAQSYGGGVYVGFESIGGNPIQGSFIMMDGAITNNIAMSGGGVYISGGNLLLSNGIIDFNSSATHDGGGVNVTDNGIFTMEGGKIQSNKSGRAGGGVNVDHGEFRMSGGIIALNSVHFDGPYPLSNADQGGGVYVNDSGRMIKSGGGTIYGNDSPLGNNAPAGGSALLYKKMNPSLLSYDPMPINYTLWPMNNFDTSE